MATIELTESSVSRGATNAPERLAFPVAARVMLLSCIVLWTAIFLLLR